MKRAGSSISALVCAASVALLAPSSARGDDAAEARLHFELGARDAAAGRFATAIEHFAAAYRLAPTTRTVFNLALAHDALAEQSREARARQTHSERAFECFAEFMDRADRADGDGGAERERTARDALARLRQLVASVRVQTQPVAATVYIDRAELGSRGTSPRSLAAAPGERTVIVRAPGYLEGRARVTLVRGRTEEITIELSPERGSLMLSVTPADATLSVDGAPFAAVQSAQPLQLSIGVHRLVLRRDGYQDAARDVEIRAGQQSSLQQRLSLDLSRASVLTVRTDARRSTLRAADAALGEAPVSRVLTLTGATQLTIEAPARIAWRGSVMLRPGRETSVEVSLGRPGGHRPYWIHALFAVGGASLVAAITTGSLAWGERSQFDAQPTRARLDAVTTQNAVADALFVTGGAALTAATIAWLLARDTSEPRVTIRDEGLRDGVR